MMRGKVLCLILVHSDETRSMIPANWTDLFVSSEENANASLLPTIATISDLIAFRRKVDFLLQRAVTSQKEKIDASRTNDSHGSHGAAEYRATSLGTS
jgi:hypothetical protein